MTRQLVALIANDLRLHGRSILLTQAGVLVLLFVATRVPRSPDSVVSLVLNLNFILALLWGDWLISREKLKGTIAWIRTLPVSDRAIVASKFITTCGCVAVLWMISSLAFAAGYFADGRAGTWFVLLLVLMAFGGLSAAARWRFNQKAGLIVPLLVVLVPLLIVIVSKRQAASVIQAMDGVWRTPSGKGMVAAALLLLLAAAYLATEHWVRRSDTFRLVE